LVISGAHKLPRENFPPTILNRKKYKVTTQSDHHQPVFDNLLDRQFDIEQIDQVYAADITDVWTAAGWLYLAVVIDLCSRKVVGAGA
jgi:transposase InsO family protein